MSEKEVSRSYRSISGAIAGVLYLCYAIGIVWFTRVYDGYYENIFLYYGEAAVAAIFAILLFLGRKSMLWSLLMIARLFMDWFYILDIIGWDIYAIILRLAPIASLLAWFYFIVDSDSKESLRTIHKIRWLPWILCLVEILFFIYLFGMEIATYYISGGKLVNEEELIEETLLIIMLLILQPVAGIFLTRWLNGIMEEEIELLDSRFDVHSLFSNDNDLPSGIVVADPARMAAICFAVTAVICGAAFGMKREFVLGLQAFASFFVAAACYQNNRKLIALTVGLHPIFTIASVLYVTESPTLRGNATKIIEIIAMWMLFFSLVQLQRGKTRKKMSRLSERAFYPAIIESIYALLITAHNVNILIHYSQSYYGGSTLRRWYIIAVAVLTTIGVWMICFWLRDQANFELERFRRRHLRSDGTEVKAEFAQEVDAPEGFIEAISEATGDGNEDRDVVNFSEFRKTAKMREYQKQLSKGKITREEFEQKKQELLQQSSDNDQMNSEK